DTAAGTQRQKVIRNKPATLVDSCYDSSLTKITSATQCAQMFPYYNDPRLVSGAPAVKDVFKCALKPVDAADYHPPLSAGPRARVASVFRGGVCDYSKPPAGKVPLANTWFSYPTPGTFFHMQ